METCAAECAHPHHHPAGAVPALSALGRGAGGDHLRLTGDGAYHRGGHPCPRLPAGDGHQLRIVLSAPGWVQFGYSIQLSFARSTPCRPKADDGDLATGSKLLNVDRFALKICNCDIRQSFICVRIRKARCNCGNDEYWKENFHSKNFIR